MVERIVVTDRAKEIIEQLKTKHGELIFHQSGGCCDGSAPVCIPKEDLFLDDSDILIGKVSGCPFYMSNDQYKYWKKFQLMLDIRDGMGSCFSLEIPMGKRFITNSRIFTKEENQVLDQSEVESH